MLLFEFDRPIRVRLHQASSSALRQFWDDVLIETMELLENGLQPHSRATSLLEMRIVLLASSQSCRSVDADAWYKRD